MLTIEESKSLWGRGGRINDLTGKPRIKLSHSTVHSSQAKYYFSPKKEGNREHGFVMYDRGSSNCNRKWNNGCVARTRRRDPGITLVLCGDI